MDYEGHVIRPPSEARSILLQVTVGCSHNRCAFCGTYRSVTFRVKEAATIERDLSEAAWRFRSVRRLFLCDGDAVAMPHAQLLDLLKLIRARLPWVERIASYASAVSLREKSQAELEELHAHGWALAYLGLESGDDAVLTAMDKGASAAEIIAAGRRLRQVGIKCSVTTILGLAGVAGSERHARLTGEALSAMDPDQAAVLTLMLVPGSPLFATARQGRFQVPDAPSMLRELRALLLHTTLTRGLFLADHASNFLPLTLRLPGQKADALRLIDAALAGHLPLQSEARRGL